VIKPTTALLDDIIDVLFHNEVEICSLRCEKLSLRLSVSPYGKNTLPLNFEEVELWAKS
jgi:hypothetical protein